MITWSAPQALDGSNDDIPRHKYQTMTWYTFVHSSSTTEKSLYYDFYHNYFQIWLDLGVDIFILNAVLV